MNLLKSHLYKRPILDVMAGWEIWKMSHIVYHAPS